jgi:hypothetical protein
MLRGQVQTVYLCRSDRRELTGLEKESQRLNGLVVDPAFDVLPAAIHYDDAGLAKLLEVM